jgi:hypothetical protein
VFLREKKEERKNQCPLRNVEGIGRLREKD